MTSRFSHRFHARGWGRAGVPAGLSVDFKRAEFSPAGAMDYGMGLAAPDRELMNAPALTARTYLGKTNGLLREMGPLGFAARFQRRK